MRLPLGACTVAEGDECTALGLVSVRGSQGARHRASRACSTRPGLRGREGALVGLAPNK